MHPFRPRNIAALTILVWAAAACTVAPCNKPGEACCYGNKCDGLACEHAFCVPKATPTDVGTSCSTDSDCQSGLCKPVTGGSTECTAVCGGDSDCIPGWSCAASGHGTVCSCTVEAEICDGKDNNCDGQIDDGQSAIADCMARAGPASVCSDGECVCHATECSNDVCTDLQIDPDNCGRCGVSCAGPSLEGAATGNAVCLAGGCGDLSALDPAATPSNFGVGATSEQAFFFANWGITMVDFTGNVTQIVPGFQPNTTVPWNPAILACIDPHNVTFQNQHVLCWIQADATNVYWNTGGQVGRAAIATGTSTILATDVKEPTTLAIDASTVYWSKAIETTGVLGAVMSVPIAGGQPTTLIFDVPSPMALALDDDNLYWIDTSGQLVSIPKAGASTTTLLVEAAAPATSLKLAIDSTNLYWSTGTTPPAIVTVPKAGGTPQTLAQAALPQTLAQASTDASEYGEVAADDNNLYWTSAAAGGLNALVTMPKSGGVPVTFISDTTLGAVSDYALDPSGFDVITSGPSGGSSSQFMRLTPLQ